MTDTPARARPRLSRGPRNALVTAHIIVSVGLLGDSAGFLAVALRAATTGDHAVTASSYEILRMFSYVFGIPLSFAALGTGLALAFAGRWSLRTPWIAAKLLLIVSVIAVGALAIDPALGLLRDGAGGETALVAAAAYDVAALGLATGLAVFKPGRRPVPPATAGG